MTRKGRHGVYPNLPSTPASPIVPANPVAVHEQELTDDQRRARDIALGDLLGETLARNRRIGCGA